MFPAVPQVPAKFIQGSKEKFLSSITMGRIAILEEDGDLDLAP